MFLTGFLAAVSFLRRLIAAAARSFRGLFFAFSVAFVRAFVSSFFLIFAVVLFFEAVFFLDFSPIFPARFSARLLEESL